LEDFNLLINSFKAIGPAYKLILKDKVSLLLALIPVVIGVTLYVVAGKAFFSMALSYGNQYIEQYLSNGAFGQIVYYLVVSILTIMLYFIVNWTFVILLSLIASPFNDLLSSRIEKLLAGEDLPNFSSSLKGVFDNFFHTVINELKKIFFIVTLSIVALLFGYIPFLTPISVFVTVLLLAVSYVDYSWARNNIPFHECRADVRKNVLSYTFGGGMFMVIIAIPLLNIIVPSLATSYFTVLWVKNNEHSNKIT
jgi:CysZ protein